MLIINNGHYNMTCVSGVVGTMLHGLDLPRHLYAFGVEDGTAYMYLDPEFPSSKAISQLITKKIGYTVKTRDAGSPRHRPAVAISRAAREHENIANTAKVLAFLVLVLNNRARMTVKATIPERKIVCWQPGDIATGPDGAFLVDSVEGDHVYADFGSYHETDVESDQARLRKGVRVRSSNVVGMKGTVDVRGAGVLLINWDNGIQGAASLDAVVEIAR
jgi:hypothetical protein